MKDTIAEILADSRYQKNIEYGKPRSGHPEGKVKVHIEQLISNLEVIKPRLWSDDAYWKLLFLIHVHDTFKAEAQSDVPILHPQSHASLAVLYVFLISGICENLGDRVFHDL